MVDQATPSPLRSASASLVGREHELASLREVLNAALTGRGSLVLIGGEAGIGKTALAEALLAEAIAHGTLVLVGRCYDLSETAPYGPWAEALTRTRADNDLPVPPDFTGTGVASQAALFTAVRDHLAGLAVTGPLVVLLDDLHWADPASLDLLRTLARQLSNLPILLLVTYRDDEVGPGHQLYALVPTLVREARARRLDLHPGVALLLRTLDDVVRVMEVSDAAYSPTLPAGVPRRGGAPRPGE